MSVDFSKPIKIVDWRSGKTLGEIATTEVGLLIMGRSTRWPTEHTTANVRVLSERDRNGLNESWALKEEIAEDQPVTFEQ